MARPKNTHEVVIWASDGGPSVYKRTSSEAKAIAIAKEWLGDTYDNHGHNSWVSMFGDRIWVVPMRQQQ